MIVLTSVGTVGKEYVEGKRVVRFCVAYSGMNNLSTKKEESGMTKYIQRVNFQLHNSPRLKLRQSQRLHRHREL